MAVSHLFHYGSKHTDTEKAEVIENIHENMDADVQEFNS